MLLIEKFGLKWKAVVIQGIYNTHTNWPLGGSKENWLESWEMKWKTWNKNLWKGRNWRFRIRKGWGNFKEIFASKFFYSQLWVAQRCPNIAHNCDSQMGGATSRMDFMHMHMQDAKCRMHEFWLAEIGEREIALFIDRQSHSKHLKAKDTIQNKLDDWVWKPGLLLDNWKREREKGNYNLAIYPFRGFTVKLEEIQIKRLTRK